MEGLCKKTNKNGVVTKVMVRPALPKAYYIRKMVMYWRSQKAPHYITVKQYVDRDISPSVADLPVCPN